MMIFDNLIPNPARPGWIWGQYTSHRVDHVELKMLHLITWSPILFRYILCISRGGGTGFKVSTSDHVEFLDVAFGDITLGLMIMI